MFYRTEEEACHLADRALDREARQRGGTHHEMTDTDTAATVVPAPVTRVQGVQTVRAAAPFTAAGQTTAGTALRIEHVRATPVGGGGDISADPPPTPAGRRLTFRAHAVDDAGRLVATGEIDRAVVDRDRFLEAPLDTDRDGPS
ncbi:thioesterase [Streptomyces sp. ME19-03-3]|nr:thioesterase [Streptomyces sp. ME19-03-3]